MIQRPRAGLLGRHVDHGPHDRSVFCQRGFLRERFSLRARGALNKLCQAEVQNLHMPFRRNDGIGGLDVALAIWVA
jgi:hypothetical protein